MTNFKKWAEPVLTGAEIQYKLINGHFVEAIGDYGGSRIIVDIKLLLIVSASIPACRC